MHPRFYKYIEDLELCGVGLSCEASVELLAQNKTIDYLLFTIEDDDNEFTSEERLTLQNVFELLAFDLDSNLFQYTPTSQEQSYMEFLDLYKRTEPIYEDWTTQVNALSSKLDQLFTSVQTYVQQENMSLFNKVYQYILYRQIDMLSDYSLDSILAYAKDGTDYILMASALEGQPLKQIARWSQQIEYDEDNVSFLFDAYEKSNYDQ